MPKEKKAGGEKKKDAKAAKGGKEKKAEKKPAGKKEGGGKKDHKEDSTKDHHATPSGASHEPSPTAQGALQPGMMGGIGFYNPRVGPFAPPTGGSYFSSGGQLGSGSSIYGAGLGHPYLRHTAMSASPLLGPRMPNSPARMGLGYMSGSVPVSSSGPLMPGGGGGGAEALMGMGSNAIALAQAFQTRMAALSSVAASLLSKRETMVHQLARVQSRMGEVAASREAIESETLADMEAVLHRLRAAEAGKFAVLQKDADVLMSDINSTDAFYSALTSFQPNSTGGGGGGGGGGMDTAAALYDPSTALQFMRAYPELCAEADRLSVKPVRTEVDVAADDFEREVANRNELSSRYAALIDLVAAKDRIILQLLKERESSAGEREAARTGLEKAAAGRIASVERQKSEEVEHWVHLADKLTGELNQVADKLMRAHLSSSGGEGGGGAEGAAASAVVAAAAALGGKAGHHHHHHHHGKGGQTLLTPGGGIALGRRNSITADIMGPVTALPTD